MTARRKPRVRRGAKGMPVLSVIVPIFNEALNIENFFERLMPVLDGLKVACEVICVDDGSIDDTRQRIVEFNAQDPRIKLLGLSRNFGKDIALTAGLHAATGQAAIPIDADLQHPPELIPNLIAKWREGYDVVYAARSSRATDDPMRRAASWLFYWIFDRFSEVSIPHDAGDFRLLDRRVIDVLNRMPERSRFMKGIFAWVGFRQIGIPFEVEARAYGRSGWSLRRLMRFAIDGLTAFSNVPLIAWGYAGALVAFVSLGAGTYFLIRTLLYGVDVPGYASLIVANLFFGGVQLLTLGIIGSYLGRVFQEVKGRPLYIVGETCGFDAAMEKRESTPPFAVNHAGGLWDRR